MLELETHGKWRLLTKQDYKVALSGRVDSGAEYGDVGGAGHAGRVNASLFGVQGSVRRVREYIDRGLEYEHGTDKKTPRGNVYRPYRLTIDGVIAAIIVMRASEAFNVCEIDVFLTVELPGLEEGATTRAALQFALADAVRNGGSMALCFTETCCDRGVPARVRAVAASLGVPLEFAERGAVAPSEARELYLRLSGLGAAALNQARDLSRRGHFSPERLAYLVSSGAWPVREAEMILLACPHPALLLGDAVFPESRHLHAIAVAFGRTAILAGLFDRSLRYVRPAADETGLVEERRYYQRIPNRTIPDRLAWLHGPLPTTRTWAGWTPHPSVILAHKKGQLLLAIPRPRAREEIRRFLRQDLDSARAAANAAPGVVAVLLYSSELLELSAEERLEAWQAGQRRGVQVLACPENLAALDAEVDARMNAGRRLRR